MILMNGERYYTVADAEEFLGISEPTVRRHILNGRIEAQKIGRSYLINEADLKNYIDRRREERDKRLSRRQGNGQDDKTDRRD